ncbi:cytochrome [Lentzea guizhouensis]|uniref:Cytochrome n=1 Tax=Lentzea guizhouensis TaxID=1586287 RepID=A0A1B2HUT9_9PSEU|nr:cytochrome P450 [Lentzea guizhouensis]ANZ41491.1 cytochrome [Lentzea guizhouensis]
MDHDSAPLELDDAFVQDPYSVYAKLGTEGSAHRVRMPPGVPLIGGLPVWLITGYDAVRSALADPRLSTDLNRIDGLFAQKEPDRTKRGGFSSVIASHMMHTDPPDHTRLRKLVSKAFTGRAIAALRPEIQKVTDGLVDALKAHDSVDLLDAFAFPLPIRVICLLLGVPVEEQERFKDWSKALVSGSSPEEATAAAAAVAEYLSELVERKRHATTDDMLTALVAAHDVDDRLTTTELISTAYLLFIAGFETTLNALGNGTLHLMRNRDQWDALRQDRSLLPGAVEEVLRLDSPLKHATFRCARESLTVGDVEIPAGDFVLLAIASANRDPQRFAEPHALDVRRPAAGHLAFGHGIHHCLGAPLARVEVQMAFNALLDAFPDMRLAADPDELRWRNSTIIRGLDSLPVRLNHR